MKYQVFAVDIPEWFEKQVKQHFQYVDQYSIVHFLLVDYLKRNAPCSHPHYEVKYSWKDTEPPITSSKVCTTCNQCIE